jgi:hypothetical protein
MPLSRNFEQTEGQQHGSESRRRNYSIAAVCPGSHSVVKVIVTLRCFGAAFSADDQSPTIEPSNLRF